MKKSDTQSRRTTRNIYPLDHGGAWAQDGSSTASADNGQVLADLVWKYFSEEITEAVVEVQPALTPGNGRSSRQASPGKG
jgi:hypothetical protein